MKKLTSSNYNKIPLGDIFIFEKKSSIKAGEGKDSGKYKFFTSSDKQSKFIDKAIYNGEYLIFSTGGKAGVHYCKEKFSTSTDCFVVKINDMIETKYVYYFLRGNMRLLEAGLKHISKEYLKNLQITYIKDKISQKYIISTLENVENLKNMRKESDELTNEFVKSTFLDMFGNIIFNKKTPTLLLENILDRIDSGTSPVCEPYPRNTPDQTAILKLSSVTYGFFNPDENKVLPLGTKITKRVNVNQDDLLFTRKNTYSLVGATAYVFESDENLLLPDIIFKLVYDKSKINGIFLWKLFSEPRFRKKIENLASGSSGSMPNISKTRLMKLEIPIPPLSLQIKFADIVNNLEHIKKYQKSTKKLLENMFNVVIQKSFNGELTC